MFDARNFVQDLEPARKILAEQNAIFKGHYVIHDIIYSAKDKAPLDSIFLRLRLIPTNIWNEASVIVAVKQTEIKEIGKQSIIPFKKGFDTKEEAEVFIQNTYGSEFQYDFEFNRQGWQYEMGEDQIDLEDIEGQYSIEFKSKTETGLHKLLKLFNATNIIQGSLVSNIKQMLNR